MESPVHTYSVKHGRRHLFDRDSEATVAFTVASRRPHRVVCLFSRLAAWKKNTPEKGKKKRGLFSNHTLAKHSAESPHKQPGLPIKAGPNMSVNAREYHNLGFLI
jgi:hypothetical protein